jgi:hypothetical protein
MLGTTVSAAGGRSAVALTANGNAQISTAQSKFGGSSGLFDGTGDYVSMSAIQYPGVDTWTVEGHFYLTNVTTKPVVAIWQNDAGDSSRRHMLFFATSTHGDASVRNRIYLGLGSGSSYDFPFVSYTLTANTWFHLAVSRDGSNNIRFFINGTQQGSTQSSTKAFFPTSALTGRIGSNTFENGDMYGHFDEFRVSKTARYTANFTTPTEPFINDANTLLLIHANGANASTTFTDDVGTTAGVTYRTDSYASFLKLAVPFDNDFGTIDIAPRISGSGLTASATKTQGANVTLTTAQRYWTSSPNYVKSADFAPGGDALTYVLPTAIPTSASGTFVIEGWFRAEATGIKWCISSADSGGRFIVSVSNATVANLTTSEGNQNFIYIGTSWTHVAFVCDGGTKRCYYNGIYRGAWLSGNTSGFSTLHLGQFNAGDANDYDGQIQDFRVYVGTNKGYTGTNTGSANFTLPSSIIESY